MAGVDPIEGPKPSDPAVQLPDFLGTLAGEQAVVIRESPQAIAALTTVITGKIDNRNWQADLVSRLECYVENAGTLVIDAIWQDFMAIPEVQDAFRATLESAISAAIPSGPP